MGRTAHFRFDTVTARDGRQLRYGVFEPQTPQNKFLVLLNGQSEFIEKYVEVLRELNGRGFTVATLDWRGQGGSARALANPLKCHVGDYAEFDDDVANFMDRIVAKRTSTPPLLLSHSMGSHMALRTLWRQAGMFRAAVTVAPMLAISTRGYPVWLTRTMVAVENARGHGEDFAWGCAERDPLRATFESQICTSDANRFARTQAILKAHPDLRVAGPTWGWLRAAYRSMKTMAAPGVAEAIKVPVLVIGAGKDRVVLTEATRRFAARLPQGRYIEIASSGHEILMEQDAIRAQFWDAFDRFTASF